MNKWAAASAAGVIVSALAGVFIGVATYTFSYAEGLSYLSEDPKACVNCHVMQENYNGWQGGSHHARATCNDCHVPHGSVVAKYMTKAEHGWRHSKGFTLNDFHEPIRMQAKSRADVITNCVRCHDTMTHEIRFGSGGGTEAEVKGWNSMGVDCIHCHASVAHGPTR